MEQLNPASSLWNPLSTASQSLDKTYQPQSSISQDDSEEPDGPICCWNICTGIHTPVQPRTRRTPSGE